MIVTTSTPLGAASSRLSPPVIAVDSLAKAQRRYGRRDDRSHCDRCVVEERG
jgi:hypothetical protein